MVGSRSSHACKFPLDPSPLCAGLAKISPDSTHQGMVQRWTCATEMNSPADSAAHDVVRDQTDAALHGHDSVPASLSLVVKSALAQRPAPDSLEDKSAAGATHDVPNSCLMSPLQVVPDEEIARLFAE